MSIGTSRWGRERARRRFHALEVMWPAIPIGLVIMGVVNAAQLAAHWSAYDDVRVVLGIYVGLAAVTALVWFRSRDGLGPVVSAVAIAAGPLACLAIATQLTSTELVGLANWVAGFSVVPIITLHFSRPPEETVLGIAALIGAQAFVLRDISGSVRDMHAVVLSGGAAAAIAAGTALLVSALRRAVEAGHELRARELENRWHQATRAHAADRRDARISDAERQAAGLLSDVAAGRVRADDSTMIERAARLARTLRVEVAEASARSLLADLLVTDPLSRSATVDVWDPDNLTDRMRVDDRTRLVAAVRDVLATSATWVTVSVQAVSPGRAEVSIGNVGAPPPTTEAWRALVRSVGARSTHHEPDRWFYDYTLSIRALSIRASSIVDPSIVDPKRDAETARNPGG
ncbi:hypothetical protein [Frankia gtarii]|uniref:hypothetical protein n=1 Tax=Frankia gtarii TaxID=2950102 RepID=UPI0021BE4986|nr:hypothetical protein [Frankia gtarii]